MSRRGEGVFCISAFFLTGVGTALLGATLPAVLHAWQLSDGRGGGLLLAGWGGSTAGALFARRELLPSAAAGLFLAGTALLFLSRLPPALPALLYLAYGIGLGMTMTSISLLRSRGRATGEADTELNRLNLVWALGACTAPALAFRSLHALSVHAVFQAMGAVFLLAGLCGGSLLLSRGKEPAQAAATRLLHRLPRAPLRFGLSAAASVGLESALGSWLTTYAGRSHAGVGTAISANLAFWAGLLLSRAAHSLRSAPALHTRAARAAHMGAVGLGMALLLLHPSPSVVAGASLLCGLGLGPLYPFVLSVSIPHFQSTYVFMLAGVGAALVPWLTGLLSSAAGSLRVGLLVPSMILVPLLLANQAIEVRDGPGRASGERGTA